MTEANQGVPAEPLCGFDELINQLRLCIDDLGAADGSARTCRMTAADVLPFAVGPHAGKGIVLKSRAALELGGAQGSSWFMLTTADESLVHDGQVTLLGCDFPEMQRGSEYPFAQVLLVAGPQMTGDCHQIVEECATVKDWIDGYFLRTTPGELTARISNELFDAGICAAHLGAALSKLIKSEVGHATAVECLFVTSSRQDVAKVASLRGEAARVSHDLRKESWAQRGIDIDCKSGGHCGQCSDKGICDRVRAIEHMRKKLGKEK